MALALALALHLQDPEAKLEELLKKFDEERKSPAAERYITISAIGQLKTDKATKALLKLYDAEKDEASRGYIVSAIGATRTALAFEALKKILSDESQPVTCRYNAVSAMGGFQSKEAFQIIVARLKDATLGFMAYNALAQFPIKDTEKIFREGLDDPAPTTRALAFRELAVLKDPEIVERAWTVVRTLTEIDYLRGAAVDAIQAGVTQEECVKLLDAAAGAESSLQKAITAVMEALTEEPAIRALYSAAEAHKDEPARVMAVRAMAKLKHAKVVEELEKALADKSDAVRTAAVESLASRKEAGPIERIFKLAKGGAELSNLVAIDAIARMVGTDAALRARAVELLLELAKSKDAVVRIAAIGALGDLGAAEAMDLLDEAMKAKLWQLRAASIQALAKIRDKRAVELLIEAMEKEKGRLKGDAVLALGRLTGKSLGMDVKPWKEWWAAIKDRWEFPATGAQAATPSGTGAFYGIPVLSDRVIFCLDISGSMEADATGTGTVTDGKKPKKNRLDAAVEQLIAVLKTFRKDVKFNVILFDTRIEPWDQELVPATKSNVEKAATHLLMQKPRGGTNIYDTLEKAFEDPNVDTVFLLSDGAPGDGKFVHPDDIVREIRKLNRIRQITIHTISLGPSPFMKKLAEENGGQYAER